MAGREGGNQRHLPQKRNELWLLFFGSSLFSKIEEINELFIQWRNLESYSKKDYTSCALSPTPVWKKELFSVRLDITWCMHICLCYFYVGRLMRMCMFLFFIISY